MNAAEMRKFFNELPEEADNKEVKVLRNYPDDASVKEIQQIVYRPWDGEIYLYLK